MINLVLDSSTLKQSEISGHPPKQMALRNKVDKFGIIFSLGSYNALRLDVIL